MKRKAYYNNNDQDFLAEKFRINENHLVSSSKIAMLKIQSWKFAVGTPEIGAQYLESIEEVIEKSFFNYVSPAYVLQEESFFFSPQQN